VAPASAIPPLVIALPAALLTHLVTQTAPIFRRYFLPAPRPLLATHIAILLPVLTHLLTHFPPLLGRQIAPRSLRPSAAGRAE
jgi:hypothetical protein